MLRQALKGEPITVHGDGSQVRTLTYIDDVIGGIVAPLGHRCEAKGQIFNITGTEQISAIDMARQIKKLTASTSEIVFVPYDQAYEAGFEDMPRRVPDLTKVQQLVGYQPKVQLDEIIALVIEYFRTQDP